jgi:hypothetical protein
MLVGVDEDVLEQLGRTGLLDLIGRGYVFLEQKQYGASLRQAVAVAELWIAQNQQDEET